MESKGHRVVIPQEDWASLLEGYPTEQPMSLAMGDIDMVALDTVDGVDYAIDRAGVWHVVQDEWVKDEGEPVTGIAGRLLLWFELGCPVFYCR